jgi:hypothetical protein
MNSTGDDVVSFDLFFQPSRFGTEPVERRNPFTGKMQTVRPVEPLSSEDLKAVRDIVQSAAPAGPDDHGGYLIELADGGVAEVYASGGIETGCMIALRRALTPDLLRFLFDLLRAADWIMLPAMEGNPAITALPGRAEGFADSLPEVVCNSAEELGAVLTGGFDRWRQYRDQILGNETQARGEAIT